jgi:hypothetical protein
MNKLQTRLQALESRLHPQTSKTWKNTCQASYFAWYFFALLPKNCIFVLLNEKKLL